MKRSDLIAHAAPAQGDGARQSRRVVNRTDHILVVDDNEDSRLALRALLESLGYRVHEASDGREAVKRAEDLQPGLILMDIMMPRMDGLEATRRIRANSELSDVRIVCISAMEGAVEASRAAGSDDCVVKPIYDLAAFGEKVESWLDSRRQTARGN